VTEPANLDDLVLVVEDSFHIESRGWVLAPALPVERFPANASLAVDIVGPDGAAWSGSGRFMVEHLRMLDGASKWHGVIVLEESAAKVPPGSRLTCRLSSSELRRPAT
jgi:hypothetical protein